MNKDLVKPSKAIKSITSLVRIHQDAIERARSIYLAQIKRAEADYFERIKHITEALTTDTAPAATGDGAAQPIEANAEAQLS
jgi:hypothetical protein